MEDNKQYERGEVFSQRVRAGKRTYFFDVKTTKSNDFYITITESKRKIKDDGFVYEKHKIFLYKEDFEKFSEALKLATDRVHEELGIPEGEYSRSDSSDDDSELNWD